ncbi:MAG: GNAT family N-acetyltransferase [Gammaproteobacteria bacterium]
MTTLPAPHLSPRYRPNASGYLGYANHPGSSGGEPRPQLLLYNAPQHCPAQCLHAHFMAAEREWRDRPGPMERGDEAGLLRDLDWRHAEHPFRTHRAPQGFEFAPTLKLNIEARYYSLRDVLSEPGYARSLDQREETQRVVIFGADNPAEPLGFVSFHRRISLMDETLGLALLPLNIYVSPPWRGQGLGDALLSSLLEVWESELHRQAARYRNRAEFDVELHGQGWDHAPGRHLLAKVAANTRETLDNCLSFWNIRAARFSVDRVH